MNDLPQIVFVSYGDGRFLHTVCVRVRVRGIEAKNGNM